MLVVTSGTSVELAMSAHLTGYDTSTYQPSVAKTRGSFRRIDGERSAEVDVYVLERKQEK